MKRLRYVPVTPIATTESPSLRRARSRAALRLLERAVVRQRAVLSEAAESINALCEDLRRSRGK